MKHLSMVAALSTVYLLSTVQGQTEQQTIKVQQSEDVTKKAEGNNIAAATEKLEAKLPSKEVLEHPNVISPGFSFFNKLRPHALHSAPGRTHFRATNIPHMLYKNRRMNPIRNHLEVKNDRKMMKPKGSYLNYRHK